MMNKSGTYGLSFTISFSQILQISFQDPESTGTVIKLDEDVKCKEPKVQIIGIDHCTTLKYTSPPKAFSNTGQLHTNNLRADYKIQNFKAL